MSREALEADLHLPPWANLNPASPKHVLSPLPPGPSSSVPSSQSCASSPSSAAAAAPARCFLIGRGAAADLRLKHDTVSRLHAALFYDQRDPTTMYIMDLDTSQG